MRKAIYTDDTRQMLVDEATANGEFLIEDAIIFKDGISGEQEKYLVFSNEPAMLSQEQTPEERILELEGLLNDATSLLIEAGVL